jgi:hypothetical protein
MQTRRLIDASLLACLTWIVAVNWSALTRACMPQIACSHLFPLLAEAAPDLVPTGTVLQMAEAALQEAAEGINPVELEIAGGLLKALGCRGMLRLQDLERTIGVCIEALRILGAVLPPTSPCLAPVPAPPYFAVFQPTPCLSWTCLQLCTGVLCQGAGVV